MATSKLGQRQNGSTVNASISQNSNHQYVYNFNDSYDILVDLTHTSGLALDDSAGGGDDQYLLNTSSGNTINGSAGNETFVALSSATDLGGNVLHGGKGFNIVQLNGSGFTADLTGDSGIEAVVGRTGLSGETVDVSLAQIALSSISSGGVPGNAFAAVIGASGVVNVKEYAGYQLVGVVDAAGTAYAPDGTPLGTSDSAALAAQVTSIDSVRGTLGIDYSGSYTHTLSSSAATYVANNLSAYVFSNGSSAYTVWTDGSVTPVDKTGTTLSTAYQPAAAVNTNAVFGTVSQFNKNGAWSQANLGVNAAGTTSLVLGDGSPDAYAAVLVNGVSGSVIHGDNGSNGGDWFGIGKSGGGNQIYGSPAGDVFDMQNATALVDALNGGKGFDVVRAIAAGADVDLTANNTAAGKAARMIDGVVSSVGSTQSGATQTVELDLNTLTYTTGSSKTAEFAAMLGSTSDTVTLDGGGKWVEVATFTPGTSPLPTGASALQGGAILDALYGSKTYTAENALTGYVFESVGAKGAAIKYATIYTDATIVNNLTAPTGALLTQAMAQYGSTSSAGTNTLQTSQSSVSSSSLLAISHA